jgi:hypothetical protein
MASSRAKNGFNYVSWLATAPQHRAWHYRQGQFDLPELARVPPLLAQRALISVIGRNDGAIGEHVEVVVVPLAGRA